MDNSQDSVEREANGQFAPRQPSNARLDPTRVTKSQRRYDDLTKGRAAITKIPKKIEAIYILLNANGVSTDVPLTPDEVLINPITKDLPRKEQNAIVKFWPSWNEHLRTVEEYKERQIDTLRAINANKGAVARVRQEKGMAEMTLGEKLQTTSEIVTEQVFEAALRISQMKHDELVADPTLKEIYKFRVQYVKDMLVIGKQMSDLGMRMTEIQEAERVQNGQVVQISDEISDALESARAKLAEANYASD